VQLLEYKDEQPCSPVVELPCAPILEVVEAWSGENEIDVSGYQPGTSCFSFGTQMQSGEPIRLRYWAGYGSRNNDDAWENAAPPPIKVAIMMLVAQWYRTREAVVVGENAAVMPFAVDALLQPFRRYR
jgi:hypothetical protein